MSITKETIQQHLKEPAVFCCQRQKGLIIGPEDLEDPTIFDDMVESGLMTLSDDGLTIEQVLGRKLIVDADALTPITKDMIDSINETSELLNHLLIKNIQIKKKFQIVKCCILKFQNLKA